MKVKGGREFVDAAACEYPALQTPVLTLHSCHLHCVTGSADNTRAALHFATAAARVMMRPQLNRVASSKAVIKAMASEIQQLKAKLVRSRLVQG